MWRTIVVLSTGNKNIVVDTLSTYKRIRESLCVRRGAELNPERQKGKMQSLDGRKELLKTHSCMLTLKSLFSWFCCVEILFSSDYNV